MSVAVTFPNGAHPIDGMTYGVACRVRGMCRFAMMNTTRIHTYCARVSHWIAGPSNGASGAGPLFGGVGPVQIDGGRVAGTVAPSKRGIVGARLDGAGSVSGSPGAIWGPRAPDCRGPDQGRSARQLTPQTAKAGDRSPARASAHTPAPESAADVCDHPTWWSAMRDRKLKSHCQC